MPDQSAVARDYVLARQATFVQEFVEWLTIPSVSASPEHTADCARAAEWVARRMRNTGMRVDLVQSGLVNARPMVVGTYDVHPGRPTVLLYGHYDVQPPDPLGEWNSPPFQPRIVGDDVFARGASDNKGQIWSVLCAVRSLLAVEGRLPVNLRLVIEGEEETGGKSIDWLVDRHPERVRADAAWMADGNLFAPGIPALYTATRGIVYAEISARGAKTDLHSGVYGGAAPNPLLALAHVLSAIRPWHGPVQLSGFYDRVAPPSEEERRAWAELPFDEAAFLRDEIGSSAFAGEQDLSVLERIWARPTFEVHGIAGGFTGHGAKTVIPAKAVAKVSTRLVPDQDPAEVAASLTERVAALCPEGIMMEVRVLQGDPPVQLPTDHPVFKAGAESLEVAFGHAPALIRMGGSLPALVAVSRRLGVPTVMTGFGLPDDRLHAPNEKFHLPNFQRGIFATMEFLQRMGRMGG